MDMLKNKKIKKKKSDGNPVYIMIMWNSMLIMNTHLYWKAKGELGRYLFNSYVGVMSFFL